jgi:hypothetical protein
MMITYAQKPEDKTYRAIRHDIKRAKLKSNADSHHHPQEKRGQIEKVLAGREGLKILELFAGQGNTTRILEQHGTVDAYDKKYLRTGDSYLVYHRLISEKKTFDVIDLDPYGFPTRFFPDVYLLIDDGYLFITMPKPFVNVLNAMTQTHLTSYFGESNPPLETIQERFVLYGLCHWRQVEVLDTVDLGRLWRMALRVKKVKATEYTGTVNR